MRRKITSQAGVTFFITFFFGIFGVCESVVVPNAPALPTVKSQSSPTQTSGAPTVVPIEPTIEPSVPVLPMQTSDVQEESKQVNEEEKQTHDPREPIVPEQKPVVQDESKQVSEAVKQADVVEPAATILPTQKLVEQAEVKGGEEVKQMQAIEPNFVPKDNRAIELFLLQKLVNDNEEKLKSTEEDAKNIRLKVERKFKESLRKYVDEKSAPIDTKHTDSLQDIIKKYELALQNNQNDPKYTADALYFLGNYYFEVDEKKYFDLLAKYNEAREQGRDDVDYPEENFNRTIDTYESLIKKYPNYSNMDSVYYMLGLAFWYEGAFSHAVDSFKTLIAKFPKSTYVEEVWFRLGEYNFDMDDYDDAIKAYTLVAQNTKSSLYDKSLYKIAWSYYQQDLYPQAIEYFVKVLDALYAQKEASADSTMRNEVIRYIGKSFSEQILEEGLAFKKAPGPLTKDAEQEYAERLGVLVTNRIVEFFNKNDKYPVFYKDLLVEMASQLLDESKTDGAILALESAIKLDPKHEDNPRFSSQIVDILQEAQRPEEARLKSQELIKQYGKSSNWYASMQGHVRAQRFAREAVRDAMLGLAVFYHSNAKQLREAGKEEEAATDFKRAAALYVRYVHEFPEREDTHKAIFYFAESAYEIKRYRSALEAYDLLKNYPLPMPDNIRRDATFNIVFTFRYVIENEVKAQRFKEINFDALTSKSRGLTKEEIPAIGMKYLASIDEFLKIAPGDEQVPVLLFHAASIYYVYGHGDEAYARFNFIVDNYPAAPAALVAARLVVDDAVALEDWSRVAEAAKRFKEQNLGGRQEDFARMEGVGRFKMARAIFEQANELYKNNQLTQAKAKYRQSAVLFEELLAEDPKNPFADLMLLNAGRAIAQSGTLTAAVPLFRKLYTTYPKSEHAKTARFQEALALEKMLKFSEAAIAYDGLIQQDPQSEEAGDAMLNKALLYEAAEDSAKASAAFLAFAKKYPDRAEAPDALLTSAAIYKKSGQISQQIAMLEQFIKQYTKDAEKRPAVIEASSQVSDSYEDLAKSAKTPAQKKQYETLRAQYNNKILALYSAELNSPVAAYYAAKAQLWLQAPEQEEFRKMRIDARLGKDQGEQLTAMMKKLTDLSKKNEDIIRVYAQPVWNAESMRRIGLLYEHLATRMLKAPCPKDVQSVDEFACDEYAILLEDKAAVLEDKAMQAYKQAYEIAITAYDAPSDLVDNIQVALNRMRPGQYQRVGNVIELPKTGAMFGQGRMLSNGRMASSLHPNEMDPDVLKKATEPLVPKTEDIQELKKDSIKTPQEPKKEEVDEDFEELGEDFE